ncbi:Diaminopimelate epimerase [Corynebacterium deserti GIMN1.010]|uniref:Diaminopimelate epimerase n=1 Tax=Corynebacterium deserti GIMN1.010 TaxID=931089 RepID=A0A0M5IPD6_9CORY|nr:diaminopimelate epimerase [Corynebacterium deserti]ALC06131.1 Diaminopimelate epimerase [Corynebacterium deserti GIMN1.010]
MNQAIFFAKGHATENDFIIISDEDAQLDLTPQMVAQLCDRRAGIGADGILRVVKAKHIADSTGLSIDPELWFMDYRNADGSLAEMCGNGVRLFSHWLYSRGLVDTTSFDIGTRAGLRHVEVLSADKFDATVRVEMGEAEVTGLSTCQIDEQTYAGLGVDMGNPHLACVVPGLTAEALTKLELKAPDFDTDFFPHGVNVEIVTELQDGITNMRVWERGVGETRSCGTGTVAAARAVLADAGEGEGVVTVRVPGGEVEVEITETGSTLTGPSKILALGEVTL